MRAKITDLKIMQAPPTPTEEQKKAERLAKLEAWKAKQAAERERKQQEADAAGGTRNLLAEIDKKAQASPALTTPNSPGTPLTPAEISDPASPAPYAGKFDPKAIARKAAATSASTSKLGALPEVTKVSAAANPNRAALKANNASATAREPQCTY